MEKKKNDVKTKKHFSWMFSILFLVLTLYSVFLLFLVGWGLLTSFRDNLSFIEKPFSFSGGLHFDRYIVAWDYFLVTVQKQGGGYRDVYLEEMLLNSFLYAFGCAFINTFVMCAVAYVATKFPFKPCKWLSTIVIITISLPIVGNLPAEINMAKTLNIYGTMVGMYIMRASFLGSYFLIFGAVFKGVPQDFTDAGYIDGAGEFSIFFKLMLPMVKDTFMTILLLGFIGYWNDYSIPLIYLPDMPPLALGLYRFNQSTDNAISDVPTKLAGCFLVLIPILLIFIIFQNKLMGNLSMGGLKE